MFLREHMNKQSILDTLIERERRHIICFCFQNTLLGILEFDLVNERIEKMIGNALPPESLGHDYHGYIASFESLKGRTGVVLHLAQNDSHDLLPLIAQNAQFRPLLQKVVVGENAVRLAQLLPNHRTHSLDQSSLIFIPTVFNTISIFI